MIVYRLRCLTICLAWGTASVAAYGSAFDKLQSGNPSTASARTTIQVDLQTAPELTESPPRVVQPTLTPEPLPTKPVASTSTRLRVRQGVLPPPPPLPPIPPVLSCLNPDAFRSSVSIAVSASVSASVSSLAANSAASAATTASIGFSSTLSAISARSAADVQSARILGFQAGSTSASALAAVSAAASASTVIRSANARADAAEALAASISSSASSAIAAITVANAVASVQASAASAISAAQASAASSAQIAIASAAAEREAAISRGASWQLGGIIAASVVGSAASAAILTFCILRYRRRKSERSLEPTERVPSPSFNLFRTALAKPTYTATVTAKGRRPMHFQGDLKEKTQASTGALQSQTPDPSVPQVPHTSPFRDKPSIYQPGAQPSSPSGLYSQGLSKPPSAIATPPKVAESAAPLKFSVTRRRSEGGSQRLQLVRSDSREDSYNRDVMENSTRPVLRSEQDQFQGANTRQHQAPAYKGRATSTQTSSGPTPSTTRAATRSSSGRNFNSEPLGMNPIYPSSTTGAPYRSMNEMVAGRQQTPWDVLSQTADAPALSQVSGLSTSPQDFFSSPPTYSSQSNQQTLPALVSRFSLASSAGLTASPPSSYPLYPPPPPRQRPLAASSPSFRDDSPTLSDPASPGGSLPRRPSTQPEIQTPTPIRPVALSMISLEPTTPSRRKPKPPALSLFPKISPNDSPASARLGQAL